MARAIWTGAVSFGLVRIPVKLYSATDPQDVQFHQFEEGTGDRVHHKRVAGEDDHDVDWDRIVKGYEVEKGKFVMVTPEELEAVEPGRTRTIEIEDFVDLDEIDPIYFEKTYFLAPQEETGAERPYELLRTAMEQTNKVAIGRFVLRSKQYLAAIRPSNGLLALETMFFGDEVRGADDIENAPVRADVSGRELGIAKQLIDSQTTSWDPKRYRDTYREAVLELIERKAKGEEVVAEPEAEPSKVVDLMEALKASVEAARQGKKPSAGRGRAQKPGGGGDEDLDQLSKDELMERAKRAGIGGRSSMSKKDLLKALRRAS